MTGAPSGIGRKITERLASNGYWVYAGARTPQEIDELNAIKNVEAVHLDVTSSTDIAAAVALVQRGSHPLRGVVNNAGVVGIAPLIEMSEQELSFVLNVNLFGPYRITKAFAPLLLATKGRVVNLRARSSISRPTHRIVVRIYAARNCSRSRDRIYTRPCKYSFVRGTSGTTS